MSAESKRYRVDECAFLAEQGEPVETWAQRLDTNNTALAKLLRRAGRIDLSRQVHAIAKREWKARQAARAELAVPKRCPCCGWPMAPSPERLAHLLRVGGVT